LAYRKLGEPITGARYVKRKFGPVPAQIVSVLNQLTAEGTIKPKTSLYHGYEKMSYTVLKPTYPDFLSPKEKAIVDDAINFVCDQHTAASISEFSHDDVWKLAQDGEDLPYFTAFVKPGKITAEDLEWAQMQLEPTG
jgi:hypothetical protein